MSPLCMFLCELPVFRQLTHYMSPNVCSREDEDNQDGGAGDRVPQIQESLIRFIQTKIYLSHPPVHCPYTHSELASHAHNNTVSYY